MRKLTALLLALALLLTGCSAGNAGSAAAENQTGSSAETASADTKYNTSVFAMDTYMDLTAYGPGAEAALSEISALIQTLDGRLSVTDETSEIYAMNHAEGAVEASSEVLALLRRAVALGDSLGGALDISLYPVLRAWGFTTEEYRIPSAEELQTILSKVDDNAITLDEAAGTVTLPAGMEIDLGAVAKGYAGDCAAECLRAHGVTSALLNLGGSTLRLVGSKPDGSDWRIAVQDPEDSSGYAGVLAVSDCAVDTSGGYERFFTGEDGEIYWHILDPATGCPAKSGLISATIVSEDAFTGDGLSTACFVMGLEETIAYWRETGGFEFVLITEDKEIYASEGIADSFTPAGSYEGCQVQVVSAAP